MCRLDLPHELSGGFAEQGKLCFRPEKIVVTVVYSQFPNGAPLVQNCLDAPSRNLCAKRNNKNGNTALVCRLIDNELEAFRVWLPPPSLRFPVQLVNHSGNLVGKE